MLKKYMKGRTTIEYLELGLLAVIVVAFVSVLYGWYSNMSGTQIGSFEYVRKGDDLLDEGDFKGSIKYFEKAYDASPENSVIAAKLRNAYFDYATHLAESEDYDKSIGCLNRAYTIMPGPRSAGKLALIYAKKANTAIRAGKGTEARSDFDSALEAASPYAASSRNLGIFLFNEAIKYYKSGKDEAAIVLLKESSLAYKNASAFELLGDIYYNKMELKRARFYFGKGFLLNPQNSGIRSKLKKSILDLRLAQNRGSEESPHYDISYDKSLPVNTQIVKGMLERCYFDVGSDLKYFPASKTIVIFYSQDDFDKIFMMSRGTRAIYDGNIRIPLPEESISERELAEYVCHEYTHAIISAKTANNCPAWFSEGLAVWEAHKYAGGPLPMERAWLPGSERFTIHSLYAGFNHKDESEENIRGDYALAYGVVRFIIDNWGMAGISGLLDRVKSGKHFTNAIDEEFLISEKEFERRWKNYFAKITS
ncbi:MAG: hypothetical protein NTZ95_03460 [Candidatus Omnitrophica bacterium]|nr:hypothetical protein [Candidatus Omnitrophota bacterium]